MVVRGREKETPRACKKALHYRFALLRATQPARWDADGDPETAGFVRRWETRHAQISKGLAVESIDESGYQGVEGTEGMEGTRGTEGTTLTNSLTL